jgi:hypothetical protein
MCAINELAGRENIFVRCFLPGENAGKSVAACHHFGGQI